MVCIDATASLREVHIALAVPPVMEVRIREASEGAVFTNLCLDGRLASGCRADVVVLDPGLVGKQFSVADVEALRCEWQAPVVFYTHPTAESLRAAVAFARLEPIALVIAGADDSHGGLRGAVEQALQRGVTGALVARLAPRLSTVVPSVRFALEHLLGAPEQYFDAEDLARRAGLSRRHVDRILQQSGLAPAKRWVIVVRAWHALALRSRNASLATVARRLGYPDGRTVRRHLALLAMTRGDEEGDFRWQEHAIERAMALLSPSSTSERDRQLPDGRCTSMRSKADNRTSGIGTESSLHGERPEHSAR